MSGPLRNVWLRTHRWVGILAGAVLAVVGSTGALMAFEDEIVHALNQDVRVRTARPEPPLDAPALLARVRAQASGQRVLSLEMAGREGAAARVTLESESARDAPDPREGRSQREVRYADPYTGALIRADGTRGEAFFRGVRALHRWLVIGPWGDRDVGRQIVGACVALFVLLQLSGLYLRWPRTLRGLRGTLWLDLRRRGRARLWNQHVVLGTWALPVYLVIALTGLTWSYDGYRSVVYALAGVEEPARGERRRGESSTSADDLAGSEADLRATWQELARIAASEPVHAMEASAERSALGLRQVTFRLPESPGDPVRVRYLAAQAAHSRAYDELVVDERTGQVVQHERYADKPVGARWMASRLALHTGGFWGLGGQAVFLLASLALPVVVVTGAGLFLRGAQRRRAARSRPAAPDLAAVPRPEASPTLAGEDPGVASGM